MLFSSFLYKTLKSGWFSFMALYYFRISNLCIFLVYAQLLTYDPHIISLYFSLPPNLPFPLSIWPAGDIQNIDGMLLIYGILLQHIHQIYTYICIDIPIDIKLIQRVILEISYSLIATYWILNFVQPNQTLFISYSNSNVGINNEIITIKLSMFKEENYQQIFQNRLNNKSIEIVKKFFVVQPSHHALNKPQSSPTNISKVKQPVLSIPKKNNPKFPGGFQQHLKNISAASDDAEQKSSIVLKSKRAPQIQMSSFLLGLTSRINRETQIKITNMMQSKCVSKLSTISPQRKIQYQEAMANLNKIRNENRTKYPIIAPSSLDLHPNYTELPLLQKRLTSPDKRSSASNSFTPTLSNKSTNPSFSSQPVKQKKQKINSSFNKIALNSISSKVISPVEQPFMKGYISYDPSVKQFFQRQYQNLKSQPRTKRNIIVSATNYLVLERQTLRIVAEKNCNEEIEIASLTKIMTCYLAILACRKYRVDPKETQIRVSEKAEQMPGTSAEIQAGDIITLYDLFYGLMLPSGNDASVAIAQTIGKIIQKNKKKPSKKSYYQTFVAHMNLFAKEIGLEQSYQNTSGLTLNPNFSTPKAATILTCLAIKNPLFYEIVNCKQYIIEIRNERYGLVRKQVWKNTNKLLWKGWQGVKTGTTETAGHCLMSCKDEYIISVFNCQTLNKRFSESIKMYQCIANNPSLQFQIRKTQN